MIPILVSLAILLEPKQILEAGVAGMANCAGFSRDGKSLIALSANGGYAYKYSLPNGQGVQLNKVAGRNRACSFNRSNNLLLIAHEDAQSTGKLIVDTQRIGSTEPVKHLDITGSQVFPQRSGDRFAVSNKNGTKVHRSETFTPVVTWPIQIQALAIDQHEAAAFDGKNILVMDFPSGKVINKFPFQIDDWPGQAFSEQDHLIISIRAYGLLVALDSRTGKEVWQVKGVSATSSIVISPNRKMVAFGTVHGGFCVIRLKDAKPIMSGSGREAGSSYPTYGVDWSADSRFVAAGFYTGEVKAWDLGHR